MGAKQQRQHRIAALLEEHRVTNQAQLVALPSEAGVKANQSTRSRHLRALRPLNTPLPGRQSAVPHPEIPDAPVARVDTARPQRANEGTPGTAPGPRTAGRAESGRGGVWGGRGSRGGS